MTCEASKLGQTDVVSDRALTFTFAICHNSSPIRLSVVCRL